jgi:tRNA A-37 threonylcarbamoyl transferase component Bud32
MELLSSIFGLSVIVLSWCFARRFLNQLRDEKRYRQDAANQKLRRQRAQQRTGETRS